jgi:hypothetical protein
MRALKFCIRGKVQAGMDPPAVRKTLGRELRLFGGVDKRALTQGKARIDAEIRPSQVADRRWRLCADARPQGAPIDIPYDNYYYFMEQLKKTLC